MLTRAVCDSFTYTFCKDIQGGNTVSKKFAQYNEAYIEKLQVCNEGNGPFDGGRCLARLYVIETYFFQPLVCKYHLMPWAVVL